MNERRIMFNRETLKAWKEMAHLTTMMPSEVVIELLKHIEMQDEELDHLAESLNFYEDLETKHGIQDDYYGVTH